MTTTDISTHPLLDAVPAGRRDEVTRLARVRVVRAGTVLTRQGETADEFFLIADGVADVIRDGRLAAVLGPGDFFGEIGLVGTPLRTATVVAGSEVRVAVIARREFRTLLSRFPGLASEVLPAATARRAAADPAPAVT